MDTSEFVIRLVSAFYLGNVDINLPYNKFFTATSALHAI